ncbi:MULTISPECIES: HlyD family type I secretion periplasmic adaptor subunit [unclassified Pseudoalteromonas]|uniref:HlyD family type I secretion periplasmic adaptor subunit n=1 Tax=unclassified Pseudoalteromonas TaxID=194690 RepID=UPI00110A6254|nr:MULTISPECIES: HlyD family type I secretion periplasmic adaptor subunit [unclassified Pseudoalteromonas]TMP47549.1 HlyD family type I secretion periplasmic adaptor subunit [Pseudoalteromonas sp. S1650]TMP66694.1 HlyD family type I secretion periplasmic adaptor subunit [Pseudoalteromonas sp. S1649]
MSNKNLPIEQRSFEHLNKVLEKQKAKRPSIFSKLFSGWLSPPNSQDWVVDAQWEKMQQQPASARLLLYIICISIVALIVWSGFAHLDEVARGEGRVIPSHKLQIVQSYDGGMVEQIFVREGQVVNAGDVLIKIDPTRFISSFRENQAKVLSLTAKVERLRALTQKKPLLFAASLIEQAPDAVLHEQAIFESSNKELEQQVTIHKRQLEQRRQDYAEARAALQQHTNSLSLANRELAVTRPLLRTGAVSDIDIIRLERQIVEHTGEINRTKAAINRSLSAINEAKNKVTEVELAMINRWSNELSEALLRLDAMKETESGLADKVAQTEIRSPVNGTVQRLLVNTVGGVLQPGSDAIEIIPLDDQLVVEAKILPKDIAFLRPGQAAMIKFSAYDFAIYGGLEAEVTHISADTITDDRDNTFYLVQLKTNRNHFSDNLTIIPGMTTQVDIITGKKTVLEYLFKPILRATSLAMSER